MSFLSVKIAHAESGDAVSSLLDKVNDLVVTPIISLFFAVAVVVFLWGLFEFIYKGSDPEARTTGQSHMIWGVIGLLIMVSAYGIINFVLSTIGVN